MRRIRYRKILQRFYVSDIVVRHLRERYVIYKKLPFLYERQECVQWSLKYVSFNLKFGVHPVRDTSVFNYCVSK